MSRNEQPNKRPFMPNGPFNEFLKGDRGLLPLSKPKHQAPPPHEEAVVHSPRPRYGGEGPYEQPHQQGMMTHVSSPYATKTNIVYVSPPFYGAASGLQRGQQYAPRSRYFNPIAGYSYGGYTSYSHRSPYGAEYLPNNGGQAMASMTTSGRQLEYGPLALGQHSSGRRGSRGGKATKEKERKRAEAARLGWVQEPDALIAVTRQSVVVPTDSVDPAYESEAVILTGPNTTGKSPHQHLSATSAPFIPAVKLPSAGIHPRFPVVKLPSAANYISNSKHVFASSIPAPTQSTANTIRLQNTLRPVTAESSATGATIKVQTPQAIHAPPAPQAPEAREAPQKFLPDWLRDQSTTVNVGVENNTNGKNLILEEGEIGWTDPSLITETEMEQVAHMIRGKAITAGCVAAVVLYGHEAGLWEEMEFDV